PQDWAGAQWIQDPTPAPEGAAPLPAPMLRKVFSVDAPAKAVVYASALGLYELSLNGQRIGNHILAPEWTDYTKRVQYQAYDVSPLLVPGDNCIGATLGDGWYAGKVGLAHIVPKGPARAIYGRQPMLLLRLCITDAQGRETNVVSDGSWQSTLD